MTNFIDAPETPIERAARRLNTLHHHLDMPRRRREARVAAEGLLDVEVMARAIHDGPSAKEQYRKAGIAPHAYADCPYAEQYRDDARAARAALLGEGA